MGVTACRQSVMLNTQKNHHAMKDSFILYVSQYKAIKTLALEQKGRLLDCIFLYTLGEDIDITDDPVLLITWIFVKERLDANFEKYENVVEKRRAAGRKGGLARVANQANQANAILLQANQANQADIVNDIVNVNVNDNVNNNNVINNNIPSNKLDGTSNSTADLTQAKSFKGVVLQYFNEKMANKAIKQVRQINNQRSEWLMARVKEYGKDAIFEMIDKAAASDFLNGRNGRGFMATFDWLMRPNNFPKVIDGNYDNNNNSYGTTNSNGYIAPELRATQERREQEERLAVRIRQLAEEDGGGM